MSYWIKDRPTSRSKNAPPGFSGVVSGYRYYNPALGRWINRDPAGEGGGVNLYTFVVNIPTVLFDVLGEYVFIGTKSVLGVASSGGKIGGSTHGYTDATNPGATIKSLNVFVHNCECCLYDAEFQFGQTVYLPKPKDVLIEYGWGGKKKVVVTALDVKNIADHEYVHAVANKVIAAAIFSKAESDCTGKCWVGKKPWTKQTCKTFVEGKLNVAISDFYSHSGSAGIEWHSYTGYGGMKKNITKKMQLKYFKWLNGKANKWQKKKYCGY